MDKTQFEALASGQTIYHASVKNANGSALRARVSGEFKEWKRTGEWRRPFKHGLYDSFYIGTRDVGGIKEQFNNPANWLEDDPT